MESIQPLPSVFNKHLVKRGCGVLHYGKDLEDLTLSCNPLTVFFALFLGESILFSDGAPDSYADSWIKTVANSYRSSELR